MNSFARCVDQTFSFSRTRFLHTFALLATHLWGRGAENQWLNQITDLHLYE